MSSFAIPAAAFLLAVVVFSASVVWIGWAMGDGFTTVASANDGYYITEFRRNGH